MEKIEKRVKKIAKLEAKLREQREKLKKEGFEVMSKDDYLSAKGSHRLPGYVGNVVKPRLQERPVGLTAYQIWVVSRHV